MVLEHKEFYVENAQQFVYLFDLEKEFINSFNITIDEWVEDSDISDKIIIETLLEKLPEKFIISFDEFNLGGFDIYKIL